MLLFKTVYRITFPRAYLSLLSSSAAPVAVFSLDVAQSAALACYGLGGSVVSGGPASSARQGEPASISSAVPNLPPCPPVVCRFYVRLLATTLVPLLVAAALLTAADFYRRNGHLQQRQQVIFTLLLMTYLVRACVRVHWTQCARV